MNNLEMTFDPRTIEHLGVKMYATLPPALAELISNAYDADADTINIVFHEQNGKPTAIVIKDNGIGMSQADIQGKFLVIGRNRRKDIGDKPTIKHKRLPTGKKGLGKLALFGLSTKITVDTMHEGLRNRFVLDWDALLSSKGKYNPKLDLNDQKTEWANGTIITLEQLKRKTSFDLEPLADNLSRIFIVDKNFNINLSKANDPTTIIKISNERKYKQIESEFSWSKQDFLEETSPFFEKIDFCFITSKKPIPPNSDLRGITIFSRGKLVNLPEYFSSSTSSHFFQYLTGWITADFIDLIDEDVISTNRQSINWDHPEMEELRQYLGALISKVNREWRERRADQKEVKIKENTGIDKENWLATLPVDVKKPITEILSSLTQGEDVSESFYPVLKALHDIAPEYPLLHWRHLHPELQDRIHKYYINQQYGDAADQGVKVYASKLKMLSKADKDGTRLSEVFNFKLNPFSAPKLQINSLKTISEQDMQEGQATLTRGIMQSFRNPVNHAPMDELIPNIFLEIDCLNVLSLISYLMSRLDNITIND